MKTVRQQIFELMEEVDVPLISSFMRDVMNVSIEVITKELSRLEHNRQIEIVGEVRHNKKNNKLYILRAVNELSIVEKEAVKYFINEYVIEGCNISYDGHAELLIEIIKGACEDCFMLPNGIDWFSTDICMLYMMLVVDDHEKAIRAWKRIAKNLKEHQ